MSVQTNNASNERDSTISIREGRISSRLRALYKASALMFFNTVLIYALVNLLLGMAILARDKILHESPSVNEPITARYGPDLLDKVYPGMNRPEREAMLGEVWTPPFAYSDYDHFRARPVVGKYVNVADAGFRKSANQGPWPPAPQNVNVFVFGGSTTFGSGLPDFQTVPSFLQQALTARTKKQVCVYNFGVGYFYSTQERIRLEKLIIGGFRPNVVYFVDGINEGTHLDNRPAFCREMELVYERSFGAHWDIAAATESTYAHSVADALFYRLPIGRLAKSVRQRLEKPAASHESAQEWQGRDSAARICDIYLTNKFLIEQLCQRYEIAPVFVWQPTPAYNYDLTHHFFAPPVSAVQANYRYAIMREYYPAMREVDEQRSDDNFLWCADIQKDRQECLYCDQFHYTAAFSQELADYICQLSVERHLLDRYLNEE